LILWIRKKILNRSFNSLNNGMLSLKGGNPEEELKDLKYDYKVFNIDSFFSEDYFRTKKIIHVDLTTSNR
jgi:16S rRNA (guanine527-N7)-methyltransferase